MKNVNLTTFQLYGISNSFTFFESLSFSTNVGIKPKVKLQNWVDTFGTLKRGPRQGYI